MGLVCLQCGGSAQLGRLCGGCSARLERAPDLCPEQVQSDGSASERVDAALIDQWGRIHRLGSRTEIGRDPHGPARIVLHQGSVSRLHAQIDYHAGVATIRDLGSTNGTAIGERGVDEPRELVTGDLLWIGSVGLFFVTPVALELSSAARPAVNVPTVRAEVSSAEITAVGLPRAAIAVVETTGGGGGVLVVDGREVRLPLTQFQLAELLVERMRGDAGKPISVRGYLNSSEMVAAISWDTAHPSENHVKQLVRRLRKNLERAGVGDLVEASQGFGYRLRVLPS